MTSNEKDQLLFTQLVLMFQTAALQQMGKLKNPLLDKIEQNLEQARISIDMIEMMHNKMKASLTPDEERFISSILKDLRLNYVDEVGKAQKQGTEQPKPESTPPTTPPETAATS